jgi:hypothetical protein
MTLQTGESADLYEASVWLMKPRVREQSQFNLSRMKHAMGVEKRKSNTHSEVRLSKQIKTN